MWYKSSFKQLSAVQRRQVGAFVGAAVCDSLVYGAVQQRKSFLKSVPPLKGASFPKLKPFGSLSLAKRVSLRNHSDLYFRAYLPALRTLADSEGVFVPDEYFSDRQSSMMLLETSLEKETFDSDEVLVSSVNKATMSCLERSYLATEALVSSLPVVVSYPWSDAEYLARRVRPIHEHLLSGSSVTPQPSDRECSRTELSSSSSPNLNFSPLTADWLDILQHTLLRMLCRNPDPLRNTALEGRFGVLNSEKLLSICQHPYPTGLFKEPILVNLFQGSEMQEEKIESSFSESLLRITWACACDVQKFRTGVLRFLASIEEIEKHFPIDQEVTRCMLYEIFIPVASIYLGALLGAKCDCSALPEEWVQGTADTSLIGSLSLQATQLSWNPNYVQAGVLPQVEVALRKSII